MSSSNIERWVNGKGVCRQISTKKDKDHKTRAFSFSGEFMGYLETDSHLRDRIKKKIGKEID